MNGPVPTGCERSASSLSTGSQPRRRRHVAGLTHQRERERRPRRVHLDDDRHRIGRVDGDACRLGRKMLPVRRQSWRGEVLGDRRAVERRAVVERDAGASLDRPLGEVGVRGDRLGEVWRGLAIRVRHRQGVVDVADHLMAGDRAQHLGRPPRAEGVGLDAHDDLATGRGLRCRCRGEPARRRCLGAAGRRGPRERPSHSASSSPRCCCRCSRHHRRRPAGRTPRPSPVQHQRALLRSTSLTRHLVPPQSLSSGSPERGRSPLSPAVTAATAACRAR